MTFFKIRQHIGVKSVKTFFSNVQSFYCGEMV